MTRQVNPRVCRIRRYRSGSLLYFSNDSVKATSRAASMGKTTGATHKPGVLFIGAPNVGKRTLISRLFPAVGSGDAATETFVYDWTIDTKYYTADVSVSVAHLWDGFSITSIPGHAHLAALVMVFDVTNVESLVGLQRWVGEVDLSNKYDVLLCVANKVDLVPGHSAHVEYRRRQLSSGLDREEFGVSDSEGTSFLGSSEDDELTDLSRSCSEWCLQHNIEYVEACASNPDMDRCLSVFGDVQGVDRVVGALSAHMWPHMILKAVKGNLKHHPLQEEEEGDEGDSSGTEEDAHFEVPYEPLCAGDDDDGSTTAELDFQSGVSDAYLGDIEVLMSEIGDLRTMADSRRREMAAQLALRVAALLGDEDDGTDDELENDH